ncbi:MAG: glycosyltransferase family 2 protein, partial [Gemmatimonadota bacterium]|nr:glycosyltransferase family 2 protein [Gemmatimonadota bacterium]
MSIILPHIFLICFFLIILYVYFGYPVLLWLLTRRSQDVDLFSGDAMPSISLIITAHNEIEVIERKIQNTLALTYPKESFEIIVASDGSDDGMDEAVTRYADMGVRLHRLPKRSGKTPALMGAVAEACGEIFVFSDANAMYEPDALTHLIAPFRDEQVGCVCGKLRYVNPSDTSISDGERMYWDYENRMKEWESRFNSLIGANGSIYALRRSAYTPLDPDLSDDYGFPLAAYAAGYRVVYQPLAVSREEAPATVFAEFKKKSRFVSHQLTTMWRLWPRLNPIRNPRLLFQIVSHKLLRNLVPFF